MYNSPSSILKNVYGYENFRPLQEQIINSCINGDPTLALLPTGGGKSICYQIPGLFLEGVCIVISPLIALITDQVRQLKERNVKAIGLTSGMSHRDLDAALDNCIYGNYKFLYLSPERLQQQLVKERLLKMKINLIAIDEAHCISQWGHDFRPAYLKINELTTALPHVPVIAVTATATQAVVDDIKESLNLEKLKIYRSSFKRENIFYHALETADKRAMLRSYYTNRRASSIIYVRSRKNTVEFKELLESQDISATIYHGGLSKKQRALNASSWMDNESCVVVATNAFGMGIDKPDVRSVVHIQLPDSIESYYQETGRAGRDGSPSRALFIYNENDISHATNQFLSAQSTVKELKFLYRKLNTFFEIALGEGFDSTHPLDFAAFVKRYKFNGLKAYNALQALDRFSVITLSRGFSKVMVLRFRESGKTIIDFTKNKPEVYAIVQSILRTYGSSKMSNLEVNPVLIAVRSNTSEKAVENALKLLAQHELIYLKSSRADLNITFNVAREDDRTINRFAREYESQIAVKRDKLQALISLLTNKKGCITHGILKYFGEESSKTCGNCSNCVSTIPSAEKTTENIIKLLTHKKLNAQQLQEQIVIPNEKLHSALCSLLNSKQIKITENNTYTINE